MAASWVQDLIGSVAGMLTTASFVPQVVKTWRSRSTRDISLAMWLMFSLGVALWVAFGVLTRSWPIMVANLVTLHRAGAQAGQSRPGITLPREGGGLEGQSIMATGSGSSDQSADGLGVRASQRSRVATCSRSSSAISAARRRTSASSLSAATEA